jgi:hypothetical protein
MDRLNKKNRNDKINPPSFDLFKGFESDPLKGPDVMNMILRTSNYDFVVDWQMNEKMPDERL